MAITSRTKTAIVEQRPQELAVLVQRLAAAGANLVLVEGFKREGYPKLVLLRRPEDAELLRSVSNLVGVVSWGEQKQAELPCFHVDDIDGIARFVRERIEEAPPII